MHGVRSVCMSSGDGSTFLSTPNLLAVTAANADGTLGASAGPVTLALLPMSRCPGAAVTVTDAASMLVPMPRRCAHGSASAVAKHLRRIPPSACVLTAHPVVRLCHEPRRLSRGLDILLRASRYSVLTALTYIADPCDDEAGFTNMLTEQPLDNKVCAAAQSGG